MTEKKLEINKQVFETFGEDVYPLIRDKFVTPNKIILLGFLDLIPVYDHELFHFGCAIKEFIIVQDRESYSVMIFDDREEARRNFIKLVREVIRG
jgi:hypothetical protein